MKRLFFVVSLLALLVLPPALGYAAGPEPNPDLDPQWKAQAAKQLKAYPKAEEGMIRYVLYLEPMADESLFKIELIVGKTVETDGVNRYGFGGQVKQETVKGWGYPMHVVEKDAFDNMFSTRIGVPANQPKIKEFVRLGGGGELIRYNSKLPIVVYVPAGGEVQYRVWSAPEQTTPALPG